MGCSGSETCLGECLPSLPTTMATGRCDAVVLQCGKTIGRHIWVLCVSVHAYVVVQVSGGCIYDIVL